jgi:hypothetical protein
MVFDFFLFSSTTIELIAKNNEEFSWYRYMMQIKVAFLPLILLMLMLTFRKIDQITEGLETHYVNRLRALPSIDYTKTIVNFILSMRTESNLSDTRRVNYIYCLCRLSQFHGKTKTFRESQEKMYCYF